MDDNQLIEIAASLEADSADAKTHIKRCKPQNLVALTANRAGLLRLAASCLRAAAEPIAEEDCRARPVEISQPHEQVVDDDSDSVICFLQRMETWPEPIEYIKARRKRALENDRWALLTCGTIAFVMLFLIVTGIMTIAGWFR